MTKNMFVITILMAILVLPIIPHTKLSVVQQNSFVLGESVYQDSPPIQIDYAGAYEYLADYGNGTSINPFVIENKSIDLSVYDDYDVGITIKYNSSYAIIRNCFFNGITTETGLGGIGIQIWHAANIVIENCIINSTARGVEIYDANTVAIIGNTFLGDSTRETGT
ncbi:MAG: right-handed parallel beta-helix repeat-containing protein, partial [Promethearchaeota archaeon]